MEVHIHVASSFAFDSFYTIEVVVRASWRYWVEPVSMEEAIVEYRKQDRFVFEPYPEDLMEKIQVAKKGASVSVLRFDQKVLKLNWGNPHCNPSKKRLDESGFTFLDRLKNGKHDGTAWFEIDFEDEALTEDDCKDPLLLIGGCPLPGLEKSDG